LGQTPPATHYEQSLRVLPNRPRAPEYGDDFVVRQVIATGQVSWKHTLLRVTRLLAGQTVGLKQIDDDEWELYYGPLPIGVQLVRGGKPRIEPLR
jgi:hypothetical protein